MSSDWNWYQDVMQKRRNEEKKRVEAADVLKSQACVGGDNILPAWLGWVTGWSYSMRSLFPQLEALFPSAL